MRPQKIPHLGNRAIHPSKMCTDVLPSNVGAKLLVAKEGMIEDETKFLPLPPSTISLRPQKHSEFEWHVETRQPSFLVRLGPREIVDPDPTLTDDSKNLGHANFAAVCHFER